MKKYDSWEVFSDDIAIKETDKSFFSYGGSGIPKGMLWFWGLEKLPFGAKHDIILRYKQKEYKAYFTREKQASGRTRIYWYKDLEASLSTIYSEIGSFPFIKFIKKNDDEYEMQSVIEWNIICNPSQYDVARAFKNLKVIDWKQSTNIELGDTVYIYVGSPVSAIRYVCKAIQVNKSGRSIDDFQYIIDGTNYENYPNCMELELIQQFDSDLLSYKNLKEHGLKSVQGPSKISKRLSEYIKSVMRQSTDEKLDNELLHQLRKVDIKDLPQGFEHTGVPKRKQDEIYKNGQKVYPRNKQTSINALAYAKYVCEVDEMHPTFIRKKSGYNYTEPHHLVPLAYSGDFDVSLDVEENIVSLCSNCHNQIHYGEGAEVLLQSLYNDRKEALKLVGIDITFDLLMQMYQ